MEEFIAFIGVIGLALLVVLLVFSTPDQRRPFLQFLRPSTSMNTATPDWRKITDNYHSIEEVQAGLRAAGLESSNLIIGYDFTGSNAWAGRLSFGGKNLHHIDADPKQQNPYQMVTAGVARTLEAFDDDKKIPAFGFGDSTTRDRTVFSFTPNPEGCDGVAEVLQKYTEYATRLTLAGPTCFAALIYKAIETVTNSGNAYHILVIIADGQVTSEEATIRAIVHASRFPLSIVMVGVGDGPWDQMETFDDHLPARRFDNFQFVEFTKVTRHCQQHGGNEDAAFALAAMMEIPAQYLAIRKLGLMSTDTPMAPTAPMGTGAFPTRPPANALRN